MTPSKPLTRRDALNAFAAFLASSPLARAQRDRPYTPERLPSLDDLVNVMEFEPVCRARILKQNYDYIATGAGNEWSLRRNRDAFDRITFRPRVLRDVSKIDVSLTLFGRKLEMPILIAPTAAHQLAHPDAELATVRAAHEQKTVMVVSSNSSFPIDKIAGAVSEPPWFQLYAITDLDATRERVEKALTAGCKAIFLTVDGAYSPRRERMLHNRLRQDGPTGARSSTPRRRAQQEEEKLPYGLQAVLIAHLDWNFVDQLKKWAPGIPVVIKGLLTAEDAKLAAERGADGIVVSNHGARYLDYAPATIEALPSIVDAVNGRIPVLMDGGIRRGTDVLKALAFGAKAVLVGRPPLWGLGAFGQPGVARVLDLLQAELALAMGLSGRPNLQSIDRSLVRIG